jgi:hypothetical protein
MSKRLVVTVDDDVYAGLQQAIGPRRISRFLNDLARPHVVGPNLGGFSQPAAATTPAPDAGPAERDGNQDQPPMEWVERGVCP